MRANDRIRRELLHTLWVNGHTTRIEFIRSHRVRAASVLTVVNELKQNKLVIEPDRTNENTGRKSPRIELNSDFGYFIGITFLMRMLEVTLIDLHGKVVRSLRIAPEHKLTNADIPGAIEGLLKQLDLTPYSGKLLGIGLAEPGTVDIKRQITLQSVNINRRNNIDTGKMLREVSGLTQTMLLPECGARAFAEYHLRKPGMDQSLLLVHLDDGIGAGFIYRGQIYVGDNNRAMEIGHWGLNPEGPLCQCGSRGCLEAISGYYGIRNRVEELAANRVRTVLTPENFTLPGFVEAVKQHDRASEVLALDICGQIATIFPLIVTLLNPRYIILSGALSELNEILLPAIHKELRKRCLASATENLKLEKSMVPQYAASYGAALCVREKYFQENF